MNDDKKYYYKDEKGRTQGPFSENELKNTVSDFDTYIWSKGMSEWKQYKYLFSTPQSKSKDKRNTIIGIIVTFILLAIVAIGAYLMFGNAHFKLKSEAHESDEFDIYIEKYYRDLEYFGISIVKPRQTIIKFAPMQFFDETKDYYGLCFGKDDDSIIEIYINEDAWQRMSRAQKYYVMYHELSHDLLNVEDDDEMNATISLMSPFMDINNNMTMDNFIELSHEFFMNHQ